MNSEREPFLVEQAPSKPLSVDRSREGAEVVFG